MVAAIHKFVHGWSHLPVRCMVLFGGHTEGNHHLAISIPVSVLRQSPREFCVYLYLVFAALLPQVSTFCILSWEGASVFSKFRVSSQMFCEVDIVACIPPRHPHYEIHIGVFSICKSVRHFDYDCTATQHLVALQQFLLALLERNSITVSNRRVIYWTFFAQNDL